jgi:hypothetical protein
MALERGVERQVFKILNRFVLGLVIALAFAGVTGRSAHALDEPDDEWDKLKACEKRICSMILDKPAMGDDLKCDVQKTWAKSSLKGGESKGMSWGFGDARCTANIKFSRADIVNALTQPKYTIKVPRHTVNCVVERDQQLKPVIVKLAPKLEFKNGKADKVWINLKEMEGPDDIKGTVWTAAKLEDTLGIFHAPMIKQINKFMSQQCSKKYGPGGTETAEGKAKAEKEKKLKETAKAAPKTTAPVTAATAGTPPAVQKPAASAPASKPAAPPPAASGAKETASGR